MRDRPVSAATSAHTALSRSPAATRARMPSSCPSRSATGAVGTGDDDGDLAPHALGRPARELVERAAPDLLVGLGQLAAHRGRAVVPEGLRHRREGAVEPVRRLEEDHRPGFAGQAGEGAGPLPGLAREEALEAEAVDGQAGDGERHEDGGRARDAGHPDAGLDGGAHQPVAGIGHRRHPGVGDDEDALPQPEPLDEVGRARGLVVLVEGQDPSRGLDPQVGAQATSTRDAVHIALADLLPLIAVEILAECVKLLKECRKLRCDSQHRCPGGTLLLALPHLD